MGSDVLKQDYEDALGQLFASFKRRHGVDLTSSRDLDSLEVTSFEHSTALTNCLLLAAPIAAGKSSIGKALQANGLQRVVRTTNRKPRPGEKDCVDYFFLSSDQFDKQLREGRLVIPSQVGSTRWATDRVELERRLREGAGGFYMECGLQTLIHADQLPGTPIKAFVLPPSFEVWMERIGTRRREGMEEIEIQRRANQGLEQIAQSAEYADLYVVNDQISRVSRLLAGIFLKL